MAACLPMRRATGLHIVQVSRDDQLLARGEDDEPMRRQVLYAGILRDAWPGSQMTIMVLTNDRLRQPFHRKGLLVFPVGGGKIGSRLSLIPKLILLHRRHPIDVLTTQTVEDEGLLVLLLGKMLGVRVVGQIHGDPFSSRAGQMAGTPGWLSRLRTALAVRALRHFFALRVVGTAIKREISMRGLHNNACVIPVPVEKQPSRQRASSNAEDGTPHLLFVGRLAKEKNLETWFHVAKRVAEARKEVVIDVVGDGDLRATLEALADRLGLSQNVRFHGWVKHEDVHRFYGAATVLLLTSWHEGFGRVLVEAYYNGVCCVASRTRGAEDVIQDGLTGFLHAPDDVEGMARSVLRLIGDVALRNRMTRNGHEVVAARFSSQNLAKQWIELLINSTRRHLPQILPPRTRTWSRYLGLRRSRFSLLRSLQYEAIQGLSLSGLTLDVGGGARNSYWHLLRVNGSILSTNISWNVSPSVLCDLNRGLPFADATFDNVLSLNTFEHVYQDDTAITESLRVLRPGGQFHFIVPLIYQIHGSPSDFHRHTPDWWVRVLEKSGIGSTRFWMDSLVWDRVSTAMSFFGTGPLPRLVRSLLLMRGSFRDVFWELQRRPFDREAEGDLKVPVGLYVFGVKD